MTKYMTAVPERITQAGVVLEVLNETNTRVRAKIVDVFFPVHDTSWGKFQVNGEKAEFLKQILVDQEREFWKKGTRIGHEVGPNGTYWINDWLYKPKN